MLLRRRRRREGGGSHTDETRRRGSHTDDSGVAMRDEARNNAAASGGCSVRMWGYLPAASPQRAPLLQPTPVPVTPLNDPLKTVCNGGCGFGIAISESGKLNTWGSTTELGQCYLISGKQQHKEK